MAEYTTGHCPNHNQPGGCQLHNLQCGWPNCDRKPVEHNPPSAASVSERARAIEILAGVCLVQPSSIAENTDSDVSVELALRAIEQALTQQRVALPSAETFASAVWRDWMTNDQADKLGAELHAWLGAHIATTPQPSVDATEATHG